MTNGFEWLYPSVCLLCSARGNRHRPLCEGCAAELPYNDRACVRCAAPLPSTAGTALCGRCQRHPPPYQQTLAVFRYQSPIDYLIRTFKFDGSLAAGRLLSMLMTEQLVEKIHDLPEAIIPVPLHKTRLQERGFDQTLELARPLARQLDRPLVTDLVRRVRYHPPQSSLSGRARRRNVIGAFGLTRQDITGLHHVALIDDVMTSGSTIEELTRLLQRGGIGRVQVWLCARTLLD